MKAKVKEDVFELQEIEWKKGATYLLTVLDDCSEEKLNTLRETLSQFIKEKKLDITFLVMRDNVTISDPD